MATQDGGRRNRSLREKENSPFTPGSPVPPELFVGRSLQIEQLIRYAKHAGSGRHENVFLSGDRGIGKSSLARYLRELCSRQFEMMGVHVVLTEVDCLEELVRRVFEQLLKETRAQPWFEKVQSLFGGFVRKVDLFGVSVTFAPPEAHLQDLVRRFPEAVGNLLDNIQDERRGLLIVLDDINGLAEEKRFADWYKSLVDHVATRSGPFPVLMVVCGPPERRDAISNLQPSLMRIFRVVDVERLDDEEVGGFFSKAFEQAAVAVEEDALQMMVHFSSGLPALMHEIGDATYWADTDGVVTSDDAADGIGGAAAEVGKKYLDPKVYRAIKSHNYRKILGKLGAMSTSETFSKREVETRLTAAEKKVFHNFLRRMRELGVIQSDPEGERGDYRFMNRIFPIYISLQSGAAGPAK